jgi:hypothetical protein
MQNIMNRKFVSQTIQRGLCAGALLLSAAVASAATPVTFQVDMSAQISAGTFVPGSNTVSAHGTFNGWGSGVELTNDPTAANTNLYTGTTSDTSDAAGAVLIYKYVIDQGSVYENTEDSQNRCAQLPTNGSLVLPAPFFDDPGPAITANVTFQVDMSEQANLGNFDTNNGDYVEAHGFFNGWGAGDILTNDPTIRTTNAAGDVNSNVYVGTFPVTGSTNGTQEYKYVLQPSGTYEAPLSTDSDYDNNNNRFFVTTDQTLPIVYFSDVPYSKIVVTNNVTFEVDMSVQIGVGNFNTNANTVEIHGDYNSWGGGTTMTNDPNSANPDIYSTVIQYTGAPNAQHYYKYVIQPGTQWENVSAANSIGGNRWFDLTNSLDTNVLVGPEYFSDEDPGSFADANFVTVTNCMVTFTVDMTNGSGTGPGGSATFDNTYPSGDSIWINGLFNGINNSFWTWGALGQGGYQMTQISNSMLFTITLPINSGQSDLLVYKYSINGIDDEAASGNNFNRWIRSLPDYTMPVDDYNTPVTESPAGNLTVGPLVGNQVQISWLGRRGVHLQTSTNLGPNAVWSDQNLTDGTNLIVAPGGTASTNYTVGTSNVFYRLVGPGS